MNEMQANPPLPASAASGAQSPSREDGRCVLTCSADAMQAVLSLTAPQGGGVAVSRAQVLEALQAQGVVHGILHAAIDQALSESEGEGECEGEVKVNERLELLVACGVPAIDGQDAVFESCLPEVKARRPKVDERGIADYRDLGEILVVQPGDLLMRRRPATPGTSGMDIKGQELLPRAGQDFPFSARLEGVLADASDPNFLRAAVTGQAVMRTAGMSVLACIEVSHVDLSSGHVRFDGSIHVLGDVKEGMKVHATGDVFIEGVVEAADIESGGNIVIKGGVIGSSSQPADVRCQGSINALYAEHARLEAGVDILIDEFSMHSVLMAMDQIQVGKPGSKRGSMVGGHARASILIKAVETGSSSGVQTVLQVGFNPYLQLRKDELRSSLAGNATEQLNLKKIVDHLAQYPEKDTGGLLAKVHRTLHGLREDRHALDEEMVTIEATMTLAAQAHIMVGRQAHGGTVVHVGNKVWTTTETREGGVFRLVDDELSFGPS